MSFFSAKKVILSFFWHLEAIFASFCCLEAILGYLRAKLLVLCSFFTKCFWPETVILVVKLKMISIYSIYSRSLVLTLVELRVSLLPQYGHSALLLENLYLHLTQKYSCLDFLRLSETDLKVVPLEDLKQG